MRGVARSYRVQGKEGVAGKVGTARGCTIGLHSGITNQPGGKTGYQNRADYKLIKVRLRIRGKVLSTNYIRYIKSSISNSWAWTMDIYMGRQVVTKWATNLLAQ